MTRIPEPMHAPDAGVSSGQPRQRAMRVDVQINHKAMAVTSPTNQQIGPWQRQAARLLALAEKAKTSGRRDPKLLEDAETLLLEVDASRQLLRREIGNLPPSVAGSTRLEDTERALQSVVAVLSRVVTLMGLRRPRSNGG